MKENMMFAWIASWLALAGQLVFFMGVALFTGDWRYMMWSFTISIIVGIPSIIGTYKRNQQLKAYKK
ncbi:hypothetical protein [Priestia megaterium]|uniref:hypothetical protein n=1 Tax=Priestia megaterium TaxID=1404 RepID=UPI0007627A93|nr:hypothetical protein [Priestia megaterium]KWU63903.1 hypothetical protein AWX17_01470 [Priestia megaterium]